MMARTRLKAIVLAIVGWLPNAAGFHASARCSACLAFMDELDELSEATIVGSELDLRRGVGKSKKGKVVPWRFSETRAYEVLDSVCAKMRGYILVAPPDQPGQYEFQRMGSYVDGQVVVDRVHIHGRTEIGSPKAGAKEHELELFCGSLIETFEGELLQSLMAENADSSTATSVSTKGNGLRRHVCVVSSAWCAMDDLDQHVARKDARSLPVLPPSKDGRHRTRRRRKRRSVASAAKARDESTNAQTPVAGRKHEL